MTKKSGLMLLVVFILALAVVLVVYFLTKQEWEIIESPGEILEEEEIIPPPATGNIDDVVNALTKEFVDEESVVNQENSEVDLVIGDNQEINDFGQSVNENELQ